MPTAPPTTPPSLDRRNSRPPRHRSISDPTGPNPLPIGSHRSWSPLTVFPMRANLSDDSPRLPSLLRSTLSPVSPPSGEPHPTSASKPSATVASSIASSSDRSPTTNRTTTIKNRCLPFPLHSSSPDPTGPNPGATLPSPTYDHRLPLHMISSHPAASNPPSIELPRPPTGSPPSPASGIHHRTLHRATHVRSTAAPPPAPPAPVDQSFHGPVHLHRAIDLSHTVDSVADRRTRRGRAATLFFFHSTSHSRASPVLPKPVRPPRQCRLHAPLCLCRVGLILFPAPCRAVRRRPVRPCRPRFNCAATCTRDRHLSSAASSRSTVDYLPLLL